MDDVDAKETLLRWVLQCIDDAGDLPLEIEGEDGGGRDRRLELVLLDSADVGSSLELKTNHGTFYVDFRGPHHG